MQKAGNVGGGDSEEEGTDPGVGILSSRQPSVERYSDRYERAGIGSGSSVLIKIKIRISVK